MDEEGSTGLQGDTVKLKQESKSIEEAIEVGIQKASDTSIQCHEETVFQFAPTERGGFQISEHRRQAVK